MKSEKETLDNYEFLTTLMEKLAKGEITEEEAKEMSKQKYPNWPSLEKGENKMANKEQKKNKKDKKKTKKVKENK